MTGQQGKNSKRGVKGFIESPVSIPQIPTSLENPNAPIPVPVVEGSTVEETYAKMMKDLVKSRSLKAISLWRQSAYEGREDRKVQQPERVPSNQEIYDALIADRSTLFYLLAEGYGDAYSSAYALAIQRALNSEKDFNEEHDLRAYLPIFFNTFYLRLTLEERIAEFKALDAEGLVLYDIQEKYINRDENNNQSVRYYLSKFNELEKYYKKVDRRTGISYNDGTVLLFGSNYYHAIGHSPKAAEGKAIALLKAIQSRKLD
jgi:hypothetical protein